MSSWLSLKLTSHKSLSAWAVMFSVGSIGLSWTQWRPARLGCGWLPSGSLFPMGIALQFGAVLPCLSCVLYSLALPERLKELPVSRGNSNPQANFLCLDNECVDTNRVSE